MLILEITAGILLAYAILWFGQWIAENLPPEYK
jgi:hypothetical protein